MVYMRIFQRCQGWCLLFAVILVYADQYLVCQYNICIILYLDTQNRGNPDNAKVKYKNICAFYCGVVSLNNVKKWTQQTRYITTMLF